jgi:hypothetical protein
MVLHALGRSGEAIRSWEAVLALEPGHKPAHMYLSLARQGARSP